MIIDDIATEKKFRKVAFVSGDPRLGQRIPLDPKDFSEMQDIWLEQITDFVKAIRGVESGIIDGCEVDVQYNEVLNRFEVVVAPGHIYVNSTVMRIRRAQVVPIPTPDWQGTKAWYFIAKPILRTFIPRTVGQPGFSEMAGKPTSNRIEITCDLLLVDTLPTVDESWGADNDWYVLLGELRINETVVTRQDIELVEDGRNILIPMREIQDIALLVKRLMEEHILGAFYFTKQPLVEPVTGTRVAFTLKYPLLQGAEPPKVYAGDILLDPALYSVATVGDWQNDPHDYPVTTITFLNPPGIGTFLSASYYPEQHVQYLSQFSFSEHVSPESDDHDNRYYTEQEADEWREDHASDVETHKTHVLWTDFSAWRDAHVSVSTTDHDNVYSRIGHEHTIDNVKILRNTLNKLEQEIGYGSEDTYVITQRITDGVDGINKTFTVSSSVLNDGLGFIKQVRADITNDAVKNPAILKVIDASENFESPSVAAFSEPKMLSQRFLNSRPTTVVQSDNEVWAIWVAQESADRSAIWFSSYKTGDGYFAPATSTGLLCSPTSRVSATVVSSSDPGINQRIVIVWDHNGELYRSYIDKGQTFWANATPVANTTNASDAAVCWVYDGLTVAGRLHVLYKKLNPDTSFNCIYRRTYELDWSEVSSEELVSRIDAHRAHPIIVQDKTTQKKVWYGWVTRDRNATESSPDYDNMCLFSFKIVDKMTGYVLQDESVLGDIRSLNVASGIALSPSNRGLWAQYSVFEGGMYHIYYQEFDPIGAAISSPIMLERGQHHSVSIGFDQGVWVVYNYLNTIYYRARELGVGEVKWNPALKTLEFERPPVSIPIYVDIAIPMISLNDRVSRLESASADTEEELAVRLRNVIESMGLDVPQQRINAFREKMIVEVDAQVDTRRVAYGYDFVVYNKFFVYNQDSRVPEGIYPVVIKGAGSTHFSTSGLIHDDFGKILNPTGMVMKIYTRAYPTTESTNGQLRIEARGDLACLDFRITSNMPTSPFQAGVYWVDVPSENLFKDINMSGNATFMSHREYGLEITIRPGGWIYDWAIFFKKV